MSNSLRPQNCYTTVVSLKKALKEAPDWETGRGTSSDPAKAEARHFSRKRADKNPDNTPSLMHGNFSVSDKTQHPYTRWLGLYFDRTPSSKWHVRILAIKALVLANVLRSLVNTLRGAPLNFYTKQSPPVHYQSPIMEPRHGGQA